MHYKTSGFCQICHADSDFSASNAWFRDSLICEVCKSIPRERAVVKTIVDWYPSYASLVVHESSPAQRGASEFLRSSCANYSTSQYLPHCQFGSTDPVTGFRSEDLEALTFSDNTFDLFITQDVMEHIFNPLKASEEIARVLKPGGAHIFSVPIMNKSLPTQRWAALKPDNSIDFIMPAEYHGNPVDDNGALVTMHYGYDLAGMITQHTQCPTIIIQIDNIELGIRAEYIDVLVMQKPLFTMPEIWS
jgi:SAM-dependent methyltransferase